MRTMAVSNVSLQITGATLHFKSDMDPAAVMRALEEGTLLLKDHSITVDADAISMQTDQAQAEMNTSTTQSTQLQTSATLSDRGLWLGAGLAVLALVGGFFAIMFGP